MNWWQARRLAKTDAIDARTLAEFGAARLLPPTPTPTKLAFRIKRLWFAHRAFARDLVRVRNRVGAARDPFFAEKNKALATLLVRQITAFDRELLALDKKSDGARRIVDIVTSIPISGKLGVGPQSAIAIAAELPEIGTASAKEIAALAGLAPMNRDSGAARGEACVKGGRAGL